jgi:siroheme synthase
VGTEIASFSERVAIDERHIPFEFVCEIASPSSVPETSDIKGGAWARHFSRM